MLIIVFVLIKQIPFVQIWIKIKRAIFAKYSSFIFNSHNEIVCSKMFIELFNKVPSVHFIHSIDDSKVFDYIREKYDVEIISVHQRCNYNWAETMLEFDSTIFFLTNKRMIEISNGTVEIFFTNENHNWSVDVINSIANFKEPEKEEDFEINIISISKRGLELKPIAIKPTNLDINLYYNNDFKVIDKVIQERLNKEGDKGIVLLHGLPGTGKTTYLRHLIGSIKKKVMFVSPSVASNLMNPEFMDLLVENPNSVLIIEDAENVILDRKFSSMSSVSNLLNISDGLLSDCLNVQIICTFNSEIGFVDEALLRKGRLIAKYEFGKLTTEKANTLSKHLGFNNTIQEPMTIAEITNPNEVNEKIVQRKKIGFVNYDEILNN